MRRANQVRRSEQRILLRGFLDEYVQGGTGDYARARGSGQGTTISDGSIPQTGNFNTYDGFLVD